MRTRAALAALLLAALVAGAERSHASFPGANGQIALATGDLWLAGADGTALRGLTRNPVAERSVAWSPDGARLAFERGGWLYALDLESRVSQRLARGLEPSWSPDGGRLVFRGPDGLYAMRADGVGRRRLRAGVARRPRWAPDGSLVAFLERGRALVMRADGRSGRALPGAACAGAPKSLAWSPDSSRLAVLTDRCLALVDVFGGAVEELPDRGGDAVAWSPDGRRLLLAADGKLRLLALDGGVVRELAGRRGVTDLDWQARCTITGTARSERMPGTDGDDFLCAGGGDDAIVGFDGSDRLFAGAGNDYLETRDAFVDVVGCGPGSDQVNADRRDLVGVDCEVVRR
jgi:Tol biopolymer transport system component